MTFSTILKTTFLGATILMLPAIASLPGGQAQAKCAYPGERQNTCWHLWYERNKIYADAGYCFKTTRAIKEFGASCTGGKPSSSGMREVQKIKAHERACGCR